jgi:hypothetical protein
MFRLRSAMSPVLAPKKSEQWLKMLDKLSACHAECRGFEPRRSRHDFEGDFPFAPRISPRVSLFYFLRRLRWYSRRGALARLISLGVMAARRLR